MQLESRAKWDSERQDWILAPLELQHWHSLKRPIGIRPQSHRPLSQYSRIASVLQDQNIRHRSENVVQLEIDLPERTTQEFIQSALK